MGKVELRADEVGHSNASEQDGEQDADNDVGSKHGDLQ